MTDELYPLTTRRWRVPGSAKPLVGELIFIPLQLQRWLDQVTVPGQVFVADGKRATRIQIQRSCGIGKSRAGCWGHCMPDQPKQPKSPDGSSDNPNRRRRFPRSFKELTPSNHFNPRTFFHEMVWKALITKRTGVIKAPRFPSLKDQELALTWIGHGPLRV